MKITQLQQTPNEFQELDHDDLEARMTAKDVEDLVEIFHTPLVGSYNWDYTEADNRIKRIYELGKRLNWNATTDLDWSQQPNRKEWAVHPDSIQFNGYGPYEALPEEEKIELSWHTTAQSLSNFLHGEQGALLVASQLVSCAPTYNAKLYAASQTFDEARHVEVFNRYLQQKVGMVYPITPGLKLLLDKVLSDERWDLKFIGMQIVIEGLALAAFNMAQNNTTDPLLRELVHYVIRDEARHVTFGINYLEEFVQTLTEEEREERAEFAYEACVVMRNRLLPVDVIRRWGWDLEEARTFIESSQSRMRFRTLLFTRVMPNLRRIGLLTDKVRERYESIGLLEFEDYPDDGVISWDDMERPLTARDAEKEAEEFRAMRKAMATAHSSDS